MISGKYFQIELDPRFPLVCDINAWLPLSGARMTRKKSPDTIYCISGNNNLYIGADSRNSRPSEHKRLLEKGIHYNEYMQNTANLYGIEIFSYQILCVVPFEYSKYRDQIENAYIKHFDTYQNGFNLCQFADSPLLGRSPSNKTRAKMGFWNVRGFEVVDEKGIIYKGKNASKFAREKGINVESFLEMLIEKRKWCGGFVLVKNFGHKASNQPEAFILLNTTTGEIKSGYSQAKFERENDITQGKLSLVLNGKRNSTKGFRLLTKVELDEYHKNLYINKLGKGE